MEKILFKNFGEIKEKKKYLLEVLGEFIRSNEFMALAKAFDVKIEPSKSTNTILEELKSSLLTEWDYRSKTKVKESSQSNIGARWGLSEFQLSNEQSKLSFYLADKMGISSGVYPTRKKYDYGIALGGAKLSNYLRFKYLMFLQTYSNIEFG